MHTAENLTAAEARALSVVIPDGYHIEFSPEPVEALHAGDTIRLRPGDRPRRIYGIRRTDTVTTALFGKSDPAHFGAGETVDVLFVVPSAPYGCERWSA